MKAWVGTGSRSSAGKERVTMDVRRGGGEEVEPVDDDGGEAGTREVAEDGMVGGSGMAVGMLTAAPVEEAEAEEEERRTRGGGG